MSSLKGVIDFDVVKCTISIVDDSPEYSDRHPTKFKIEEVSSKTVFIFEATMESTLKKWMNAIIKNHSVGEATKNPKFIQKLYKPQFWTLNTIRAEMLNDIVESGDILLSSNSDFMASV